MVAAAALVLSAAGSANPSVKIVELGQFQGVWMGGHDGMTSIRPGEQLTVIGEYDDDDFDAFQIIRANGEVMTIRSPGGPPPWAGGRRRWQQSWR
ncbi:MAG: hypothetical protein Q6K08_03360 [Thermostichales cyanobacterium GMQP_bins_62]